MNIDDLTLGQIKELTTRFGEREKFDNGMIGKYVVVRCRDAGVHSGILQSHTGRECVLTESRWLWSWKTKSGALLSALAVSGLSSEESQIGREVERLHLTENCEIIQCTKIAEASIREQANINE